MYSQGQLVRNTVDGSRPGYNGNYNKDKTALSADVIKKIKNKIKLPVGQKWSFYDPNPNSKTYNPNGDTYGIKKSKFPKLWERGRNIGKEGRAEKKLIQATDAYKKIKANPDLLAEKQLYDREIYMGKREQILEDLNFKYATDKKFREAKIEYEKIQRIENPEKYKQKNSDFYAKHGKFPPGNNYKENVWHDMFRSSQKGGQNRFLLVDESGKLLTPDNFPKVDGKVRWGVNGAYKNAKFYDTTTEQFVKFDDTIKGKGMGFEKYLDQKSVGGNGAFNNAVDGYKIKDDYKNLTFKNAKGEKIRLGTLMQSKLKTKTDFIKSGINIQHPDLNNAFWKNEVSTATSNMGLNKLEQNLNRDLKAYKNNPIKRAETLAKFKINIEKLPGGITKVIEGTTYGIKPTGSSVLKAAGTEFGATKYKSFRNLFSQTFNETLSPRSIVQLAKEFDCGKLNKGGSIMSCLKTKFNKAPEKFLQRSAPLAKGNPNLFKWFKNGRKIARGTGVFLAWEAAFAPIIAGWSALEGESGTRMINEIAYGIPFIGETEKEEWKREAGNDEQAYTMKKMGEIEEQELPYLQQQLEQAQAKSAPTREKVMQSGRPDYTGYHEKEILEDIKEKKLELQGYYNTPELYEGPAGKYLDEPAAMGAFNLAEATTAKIAADKAGRKKKRFDWLRENKIIANKNWQSQMATGGRAGYMGGGIMNLKKNKW